MQPKYLLIIPFLILTLMGGVVLAPQDASAGKNLVKPYLVYPADKPMYPEYEAAINNTLEELQNWYLEKVGITFELAPLQIKRTSENYVTIRCGENPSQECINNQQIFDVDDWLLPLNEAIHNGQVQWFWETEQEEKSIALIFGVGWGGYTGGNGFTDGQYAGDYGFAVSGDWVLEPISGVTNTWGVPCSLSDGWQCTGGVPKGTIVHELTHAFGMPHPGEGPSIMDWHGDYPTVGFLPSEIEFLQSSPFLVAQDFCPSGQDEKCPSGQICGEERICLPAPTLSPTTTEPPPSATPTPSPTTTEPPPSATPTPSPTTTEPPPPSATPTPSPTTTEPTPSSTAPTSPLSGISTSNAGPSARGGLVQCGGTGQDACGFCDIFVLVNNVIRFFLVPTATNGYLAVVPLLATLFFVVGGFFILTGGASPGELLQGGGKGDPVGLKKGRNILLATVIGLIIIYGSWIFITLIFSTFTTVDWSSLQLQCGQ